MIGVSKSSPPASLVQRAAAARQALERAYEANPAGCQRPGTPALKPRRAVYAAKDVKKRLIADQHGKCAYCETRFLHSSSGDVEHYRPKAGYRQAAGSAVQGPGYYWLAYEWDNLLFACEDCNRMRKRQLFPLRNDPLGRARTHHDEVSREEPLLLNPAHDNPEQHLTFLEEAAKGVTPVGEASVAAYSLNRPELLDDRRERLRCVRSEEMLARIFEVNPSIVELEILVSSYESEEKLAWHIAQARLAYERAAFANAEFAGMVRANFPQLARQ